jgi:hypothetical protein
LTNQDLEAIYNAGIGISHQAGLREVFNAGYYSHAGITPGATTQDAVPTATAPTAVVKLKDKDR